MNKNIQDVHPFYEGNKQIAIVDNTDALDIKVILIDKPGRYVQRFFVISTFSDLVNRTKTMRSLNIPSL